MNVFEIDVHPAANVFPMLSQDELAELANDISENGLRDPIVLQEIDGEPVLIDGRNRRAACKLAKVDPEVRWLNGEDATSFIWSTNGTRRHLNAGQRALAYAMLYPKGNQGKKSNLVSNDTKLPHATVSRARAVLKHKDLARQVMDDTMKLNAAYQQAKDLADEEEKENQRQEERRRWLERIRREKPYLAEAVDEEKETLEDAIRQFKAFLDEEEKRAFQQREMLFDCLSRVIGGGAAFSSDQAVTLTAKVMRDPAWAEQRSLWFSHEFEKSQLQDVARNINALLEVL